MNFAPVARHSVNTALKFHATSIELARLGNCPCVQNCGTGLPEAESSFAGNPRQLCASLLDAFAIAKDLANDPSKEKRQGEAVAMTDLARFGDRFVVRRQSLIRKPKRQQCTGEIVQAHDPRIECVNKRRRFVLAGVVESQRLLQMRTGAGELAGRQCTDAGRPMSKER